MKQAVFRRGIGGRAAALVILCAAPGARALDGPALAGRPVQIDVTNAGSVLYNADNRNSRPGSVVRRIDDDWGVFYNRLNVQASSGPFQLGLRLDSALFYATPDPTKVALDLTRERHGGALPDPVPGDAALFFVQKTTEASNELVTRYTSWTYPAKYYLGYSTPDVEATVGDFYAQLGRGLVLSVRKLDELSSDTTVRGARMTYKARVDDVRLRMTALGGAMNPLRFDEASGRYLGVGPGTTTGLLALTEAGMPRAQASPFESRPEPTYAPDRVVGAQIEGGPRVLQVGVQGALFDRTFTDSGTNAEAALSPGTVRSASRILNGSVSVAAPDLGGHGALYFEAALQNMTYPSVLSQSGRDLPDSGHALYASATVTEKPVTFTFEGKHYRRFYPLLANVNLGRAPEFSVVQYSAPPTAEAFWVDTEFEGFNTCVTGGRLRADVEVGGGSTVFAWLGRYLSWAESVANARCETGEQNENRVWDVASGAEHVSKNRKTRVSATIGGRTDDTPRALPHPEGGETHLFYQEAYLRYDVTTHLGGPFTLKLQGWDRRRHQTQGGIPDPWTELQHLFALDIARFTVGAGYEYTGNPQFPDHYFNGLFAYAINASSNVSLFAGQRRGGLRCVSGVCRVYPPFEGVRLDVTVRF